MAGLAQLIVVAILSMAHIAPVGGAAHSTLFKIFTAWPIPAGVVALAFTVGVLLAVMTFFWQDLADMVVGVARASKGKRHPGARLAGQLFAATIPVAGAVFALPFIDLQAVAETPLLVGWAALIGGALFFVLDRMSMTIKRLEHASYVDMIVIALTQVVAFLVPGVSRSAITMTFARLMGYERVDAARFSMLLSMPALAGLCVLQVMQLARDGVLAWYPWLIGIAGVSFLAGLIMLAIMMTWLRRRTFAPFAVYRMLIGALILALVWQL